MRRHLRGLRGRALLAVDAAVLWRLGMVRIDPPGAAPEGLVEPARFWRESGVAAPARVEHRHRASRGSVEIVDLTGPSTGPGSHPGSREVHGRAWLNRSGDAGERPLVVLLHGFAAPVPYYEDWHARRLLRRGAHAARIDLPFHMTRLPARTRPGDGYFSSDLAHTRAVLRQTVEDAAAVVAWARREVGSTVAVLGFSLGGLAAMLLAACVRLDAVVAVTPPCDLPELIFEHAPMRVRRRLGLLGGGGGPWAQDGVAARRMVDDAMAPLVPHRLVPVTEPARMTVVAAEHDAIVGAAAVRRLASAWAIECWDYPHGHISVMTARGITDRIHRHLLSPALPAHRVAVAG